MPAVRGVRAHPDVRDQVALCLLAVLALSRACIAGHVSDDCCQLIHGPAHHAGVEPVTFAIIAMSNLLRPLDRLVALRAQGSPAGKW